MNSDEIPDSVEFTENGGWVERWDGGKWRDAVDVQAALDGCRVGYVVNEDKSTAHVSLTLEWIFAGSHHEGPALYADRHTMRAIAEGILEAIDDGLPDEISHMELR